MVNMDVKYKTEGPLFIFGGPYSNLTATQAAYAEASRRNIPADRVICTGDLVAYCAEPDATVDLIRRWGCHVVMGNCEESLAEGAPDCGCGFSEESACSLLSIEWYRFASEQVSAVHKQWMGQLPRQIRFTLADKRFLVVHGSVDHINEFIFASSSDQYKEKQLMQADVDVIIGGHCGIPFASELKSGAWLNAGVIGMPANDGTPDGWYMIIQPTDKGVEVSWHRLEYDEQASISAMTDAQISQPYARCLQDGLWPSLDVLPSFEKQQRGLPLSLRPILIR